MSGAMPLMICM